MNGPERLSTKTRKPFTGCLWDVLTMLTYSCYSPILTTVLAGTATGTSIGEYWGIAVLTLIDLFVLSVMRLLRAFWGGS